MLVKNFRPYLLRTFKTLLSCYLSVATLAVSSVQAAPPQTLDYQGYLADNNGVPLTGSQDLTIRLYAATSGGPSLWKQSGSYNLINGRFSVILDGTGASPFPAGLFDQQLFVGLTVDGDVEMTPRQPLTSVPSAFEAINADTVDGMEANEIIDAASDEVRTPISSLPFTISESGSYYFTQNLVATAANGGNGLIDINADDVTLDLMGFTLDCNGVTDYGIQLGAHSAVVIENGSVRDCGFSGIRSNFLNRGANAVTDMQLLNNGSGGANWDAHSGLYLRGGDNRIERVTVVDSGAVGIYSGEAALIKDCFVSGSGSVGIYSQGSSIIVNNIARENQETGIYVQADSVVSNNLAIFNFEGIGAVEGSTVINNVAASNDSWGISVGFSSTVIANTVRLNNRSGLDGVAGLHINSSSMVKENTVQGNEHTGIHITGSNNILKDNHVTGTANINGGGNADGYCYEFNSSDNAATGNAATGCTTNFGGDVPPLSRFFNNLGW